MEHVRQRNVDLLPLPLPFPFCLGQFHHHAPIPFPPETSRCKRVRDEGRACQEPRICWGSFLALGSGRRRGDAHIQRHSTSLECRLGHVSLLYTTVSYRGTLRETIGRAFRRAVPLAALPAVLVPSVLAAFELRVSRFSAISSAAARFLPAMQGVRDRN